MSVSFRGLARTLLAWPYVRPVGRQEVVIVMSILGWMFFGLIVGLVAKLVMPGKDPGGIFLTMGIGIIGALLGGLVGRAIGLYAPGEAAGFIMATLGAVALLALYRTLTRRTA